MSAGTFDPRQVRRAFSRAARTYDAAATLQHGIEQRLLESLDYFDARGEDAPAPAVVLDLGCGPGRAAAAMHRRWPRARVVALDHSLAMLRHTPPPRMQLPWRNQVAPICADVRCLPLADGTVDVLFSNLCLQWVDDLPAVFAGFRRVLRPGGLVLLSTFGPETLHELRTAFARADAAPHVSPFVDIAGLGDVLMRAGFRDPVLDRDLLVSRYPDLPTLMRELRALGATNALQERRHTLTGKSRFALASQAYAAMRGDDGLLPVTWETLTAMAWAPEPGAPIREGGFEVTAVPLSSIPFRRRG